MHLVSKLQVGSIVSDDNHGICYQITPCHTGRRCKMHQSPEPASGPSAHPNPSKAISAILNVSGGRVEAVNPLKTLWPGDNLCKVLESAGSVSKAHCQTHAPKDPGPICQPLLDMLNKHCRRVAAWKRCCAPSLCGRAQSLTRLKPLRPLADLGHLWELTVRGFAQLLCHIVADEVLAKQLSLGQTDLQAPKIAIKPWCHRVQPSDCTTRHRGQLAGCTDFVVNAFALVDLNRKQLGQARALAVIAAH